MKKILAILALALPLIMTSCLQDKMYEGPSSIDELTLDPEAPTSVQEVTVTAKTSGLQEIVSAVLTYNNGGKPVQMTGSGNQWTGKIPPLPDKTKVTVTVVVTNSAGFTTSKTTEYTVGNPPVDWSKLVLNELYGAGEDNEKFLELFNNSNFPISLKGVTINKDEELCWTGLENEVCPPHGVFAIIGAKGTTERGISSGFSAKKSVLIELFNPSGQKIDYFQRGEKGSKWGEQGLDNNKGAWARIPDGTGKIVIVSNPTPGKANDGTGAKDDPDIK